MGIVGIIGSPRRLTRVHSAVVLVGKRLLVAMGMSIVLVMRVVQGVGRITIVLVLRNGAEAGKRPASFRGTELLVIAIDTRTIGSDGRIGTLATGELRIVMVLGLSRNRIGGGLHLGRTSHSRCNFQLHIHIARPLALIGEDVDAENFAIEVPLLPKPLRGASGSIGQVDAACSVGHLLPRSEVLGVRNHARH